MRIAEMSPAFEGWSKPSSGRSRDSSWRCPGPWLQRTWPWQLLQPIAQSPACVHRPDVYKIPEIVLDFSMYAQKLAHAHAHCSLCHAGMPCVASWQSLFIEEECTLLRLYKPLHAEGKVQALASLQLHLCGDWQVHTPAVCIHTECKGS